MNTFRRIGTSSLLFFCVLSSLARAADTPMPESVAGIAHRWASISYHSPEKNREQELTTLAVDAEKQTKAYPGKVEPLVWQAIVLASAAKAQGGLGALSKAKQARDLLLEAEKMNPSALNGAIYTSLGSLYAKVPGWPIGFGNADKARSYLETALKLNPTGMDANYFYADFLVSQKEYAKAMEHLTLALAAPARIGREDADAGRRKEVESLITDLRANHRDNLQN